jgi:hypothetical protein
MARSGADAPFCNTPAAWAPGYYRPSLKSLFSERRRRGSPSPFKWWHSNERHQKWDSYAAGLGLTDTYRLLHGDLKGGFTRYTDSIDTRIV